MELVNLAAVAFFVIIGVGFPSYAAYIDYQSRKKRPWHKLAALTNLTYKPVRVFGGGDSVTGMYRGYELRLDTVRRDPVTEEARTRISLSCVGKTQSRLEQQKNGLVNATKDVNSAIQLLNSPHSLRGEVKGDDPPKIVQYIQDGIETEIKYLQLTFDLLCDIADVTPVVIGLGGEAAVALKPRINHTGISLHPYLVYILREIGEDTSTRLGHKLDRLLCPRCLTRFEKHKIRVPLNLIPIVYCGCRVCHQSREYLTGKVIATLNRIDTRKQYEENATIWINWLLNRTLFDFDAVYIEQATDEEVERFAVQVGNDTDETRKQKYKDMECKVSLVSGLTENSIRILRRMFGRVEIESSLQMSR